MLNLARVKESQLATASVVGMAAAIATYLSMLRMQRLSTHDRLGEDFGFWWRAAQALRLGENPYHFLREPGVLAGEAVFSYPLPAAIAALPFSWISDPRIGAAIFVGLGFALAAIALHRLAPWRLVILITAPAFWILENGQWAPYLLAAAIIPWLGWLLAVKPTIGAALFIWRPTKETLLGGTFVCAVAFVFLPSWPFDWIESVRAFEERRQYAAPITVPGGLLLLGVLLRWRRPESRLVLALACVPQNFFFYDQLPLMLVPRSLNGLLCFAMWTHVLRLIAFLGLPDPMTAEFATSAAVRSVWMQPYVLWGLYIPCLIMILARPNEGPLPARVEQALVRSGLPRWLKGQAPVLSAHQAADDTSGRAVV